MKRQDSEEVWAPELAGLAPEPQSLHIGVTKKS